MLVIKYFSEIPTHFGSSLYMYVKKASGVRPARSEDICTLGRALVADAPESHNLYILWILPVPTYSGVQTIFPQMAQKSEELIA